VIKKLTYLKTDVLLVWSGPDGLKFGCWSRLKPRSAKGIGLNRHNRWS